MSTPLQGSLFFFFSFLKDVICSYTFVFWKRQSALPLFNQHMVLCVLVKVENSYPFSLIQYMANKLYIIFPQQVLSWLFLFLIFDFQREIIGHKAFWRKGENKKKKREWILPCWAEHLWACAIPAKNYKTQKSYKTGCWHLRSVLNSLCCGLISSPFVKWG